MEGRNGTGGGWRIGRLCVSIWCCSWVDVDYDQDCCVGGRGVAVVVVVGGCMSLTTVGLGVQQTDMQIALN